MTVDEALRIGIDTGGTFTDVVAIDAATGRLVHRKTPSTPSSFDEGVLAALDAALAALDRSGGAVDFLGHGTTVGTNAVLEGSLPPLGLLTNEGLTDVLEIGDQTRPSLYDLQAEKPDPPVPRRRRLGVPGRIDADGREVESLDEDRARAAVERLVDDGVEAIVVSMLFAHLNPAHERRIVELVERIAPEVGVARSSAVHPERREYERTVTTVLNEGLKRTIEAYLERFDAGVRERGVDVPVHVMHAGGGSFTAHDAVERALRTVLSGPAAGAVATRTLGTWEGYPSAIGVDMGGTSTDVSLLREGELVRRTDGTIAGHPIAVPMIDIATVGAGGGSVVWIDDGGALRVGPNSAGAEPGPVCYGRGGKEPTITDAQVLLGRLAPDRFLGGRMDLDVDLARDVFRRTVAEPLDLDVPAAAMRALEVAHARLDRELRRVTVERGEDPRGYALVAFGGAGPLHACALGSALDVEAVVVPPTPGVFSAYGLLLADVRIDESRAARERSMDPSALAEQFASLAGAVEDRLAERGFDREDVRLERALDLRYVGQSYELTIPVAGHSVDAALVDGVVERFHRHHERRYGHAMSEEPVEAVTLRCSGVVPTETPEPPVGDEQRRPLGSEARERSVYFPDDGFVPTTIRRRDGLGPGDRLAGPAIVEESGSTTVIPPGRSAVVSSVGSIVIEP